MQLLDGKAGDLLTIGVDSLSVASATIKVFEPDGTSLTSGTVSSSGQGVQLPKLPTSGTYAVVVDPGTNSGTIALSIVKPLQAALALDGTPTAVSITPPGRRALLTFAGVQGTYANISLSGVTLSAGTVSIIAPNGAVLDAAAFGTSNGGSGVEPQLPQSGLYMVLIDPSGSIGGALNVALTPSSTPSLGVNQSVSVNLPNQAPVNLTFRASAGQYLSLGISETGVGSNVTGATLKVLKPDGTALTTGTFTASSCGTGQNCYYGTSVINMGPLPTGGTYTVVLQQTGSGSGALTLVLSQPVTADMSMGTASSVAVALTGQAVQVSFAGAAGQYVAFAASENDQGSAIRGAAITVINPDGSTLKTGSLTAEACPALGCNSFNGSVVVNLGPLPMTGTYTVLVQQTTGGTGTFDITVSNPVSQALTAGTSSDVSVSLQGQPMKLTFSGATGQYFSLGVQESQGQIPDVTVTVLNPDGTVLTTGAMTAAQCPAVGCNYQYGSTAINFGPLSQDGTYTVLIQQQDSGSRDNQDTGTLTVTLANPMQASLSAGISSTQQTTLSGQAMELSFAGASGQYLALGVQENQSGALIAGITVTVFKPDGTILTTSPFTAATCGAGENCYYGNWVVNMGPLPADGNYMVLVQQSGPGTGALTFTLSSPIAGQLSSGITVSPGVSLAGQSLEETFSGTAGQYFSLGMSESTQSSTLIRGETVTVLKPDGTELAGASFVVVTTACTGGNGTVACENSYGAAVINMGPLPTTGTYTVLMQQTDAGAGSLTLTLSNPVDGGMLSPSTPVSVQAMLPGQPLQVEFAGTAGTSVGLQVQEDPTDIASATISIMNPDGTPLANGVFNATASGDGYTGSAALNPSVLPQTGTYTVIVKQTSPGTGALTFTATGIQPPKGSANTYSTSTAGQVVPFAFSGAAGQSVSLALTNLVVSAGSPTDVEVSIKNPDGSFLTTGWCHTNGYGCEFSLLSLPQSGTYQVQVSPANSSQTMSFTTTFSADAIGTLSLNTPTPVSLSSMGQSGVFTFTASAGQTVALNESGITTTPSGTAMEMAVYNSAGTQVGSTSGSSFATLNLPNLAADTYRVQVYPTSPATSNLQLTLEGGVSGALPSDGSSTNYSTPAPGQNAYFTFSGTAGQSVSLALTNIVLTPSSPGYVQVYITQPDGTGYNSGWNCWGAACEYSLFNLPQSGTYQVRLIPGNGNGTQTMSFTTTLSTDVTGTLSLNTPTPVSLSSMGQSGVFTFTASAGQTVALNESGVTSTPSGTTMGMTVYNSAGTQVGSTFGSSFATLNLPNLAADTYRVQVYPTSPATSNLQLTLYPGMGGSLPSDGSSTNYSAAAPGQNAYFTFSGTAGQSMSVALTNLVLTPNSPAAYAQVSITSPSGTQVSSCYTSGGNCELSLFNLSQSGTYNVQVVPWGGNGTQTMSFTVALSADATGSLSQGTTSSLALSEIGQSAVLEFTATAGESVTLSFSDLVTSPAGITDNIVVYGASGSNIDSTSTSKGATLTLSNLAAGNYSVLVSPSVPATSNFQIGYQ